MPEEDVPDKLYRVVVGTPTRVEARPIYSATKSRFYLTARRQAARMDIDYVARDVADRSRPVSAVYHLTEAAAVAHWVRVHVAVVTKANDVIISITKYLADLGYGPDGKPLPWSQVLEDLRTVAADGAFVDFEFSASVEGDNPWQHQRGDEAWTKVVFLRNPDGGDSIKDRFVVRFKPGTADVEDVYSGGPT